MSQDVNEINILDKCTAIKLSNLLGFNPSMCYQLAKKGVIPVNFTDYTFQEVIQAYIKYYKDARDLKELRTSKDLSIREQELAAMTTEATLAEEMALLQVAKLRSGIKLDNSKIAINMVRTLAERGKLINLAELAEIAEPIILTINGLFNAIQFISPEQKALIQQVQEQLYNLGIALAEQTKLDKAEFIDNLVNENTLEVGDL